MRKLKSPDAFASGLFKYYSLVSSVISSVGASSGISTGGVSSETVCSAACIFGLITKKYTHTPPTMRTATMAAMMIMTLPAEELELSLLTMKSSGFTEVVGRGAGSSGDVACVLACVPSVGAGSEAGGVVSSTGGCVAGGCVAGGCVAGGWVAGG